MSRFKRAVGVGVGGAVVPERALGGARTARWSAALVVGAWLSSCGALVGDDVEVGGETHFLVTCEGGCGPGLSCIEGACTQRCEPGGASCSALSSQATCVEVLDGTAHASILGGMCEVTCAGDTDCTALGAGYSCLSGVCRATPEESLTASFGAPLTRAVGADTCRSGLLWVGESRPSAEMRPGSDCVGCHEETGALPLAIGGTVYPIGGPRDQPEADDCFGVEGVEVTVVDDDGRERKTFTNRAGNFYFEATELDLSMPYGATIRWKNFEGVELLTPMATFFSYGGCARCHSPSAVESPLPFDPYPDPGRVIPAGPIFTPGLYPD